MQNRTRFDLVVSMMMCEIGDDELFDMQVRSSRQESFDFHKYGYYTDVNGIRRWGLLPAYNDNPFANLVFAHGRGNLKSNVLYLDEAYNSHVLTL
jgi:hypothetical protein